MAQENGLNGEITLLARRGLRICYGRSTEAEVGNSGCDRPAKNDRGGGTGARRPLYLDAYAPGFVFCDDTVSCTCL